MSGTVSATVSLNMRVFFVKKKHSYGQFNSHLLEIWAKTSSSSKSLLSRIILLNLFLEDSIELFRMTRRSKPCVSGRAVGHKFCIPIFFDVLLSSCSRVSRNSRNGIHSRDFISRSRRRGSRFSDDYKDRQQVILSCERREAFSTSK